VKKLLASVWLCLALLGCADDGEDLGTYYEFSFTDDFSCVIAEDSVRLVVLQSTAYRNNGTPTLAMIPKAGLGDTIMLAFTVRYGGYASNPEPRRSLEVVADSIRVKYDGAVSCHFCKPFAPVSVLTSPRNTYYVIDSVTALTAPGRTVAFQSRFVP
jgi:hypothetical protein